MILSSRTSIASLLLLFVALATPGRAQQITSTQIASLPDFPIGVTAPPSDTHRIFVIERSGRIRVIRDGVLLALPFLDITPEVLTDGERGLLGLTFHPSYAANGRFFMSFTGAPNGSPRLREYHVGTNPDVADPASGVDVIGNLAFYTTGNAHYGSDIHFGPDGMLYYALGGGSGTLEQRLGIYNGKLLRIDVDAPPPHVPSDNPYASGQGGALPLIWARGFRNPWRFSFDRLTGDLYLGDVGGVDREEINFQLANSGSPGSPGYQGGRNYGYPCMEGSLCHDPICPCDPSGATLVLPAFEWIHGGGACSIGGFVYRGSAIPGLRGRYLCADMSQRKVWSILMVNGHATDIQQRSHALRVGAPGGPQNIVSFGEDADGELYLTSMTNSTSGAIFRIDPAVSTCPAPVAYCTTSSNSSGNGAQMFWSGSASISNDDFVLVAGQAPLHSMGAFRVGTQEIQQPFGNGWSCVGGTVVQLSYLRTDAYGETIQRLDYSSISVSPGQTRDFQFIFRDAAGGGSGFNLTNGLRVVFCP